MLPNTITMSYNTYKKHTSNELLIHHILIITMTTILATIANKLPNEFFSLFSVNVMHRAIELERIN